MFFVFLLLLLFSKSFIPSGISLWNNLFVEIRNSDSIDTFKNLSKEFKYNQRIIPKHFVLGKRFESVHHARNRNQRSNLNNDLYSNHLALSAFCDCGEDIEDAEHFFFNYNRFNAQRLVLFRDSRKFHPLGVQFILEGSDFFIRRR